MLYNLRTDSWTLISILFTYIADLLTRNLNIWFPRPQKIRNDKLVVWGDIAINAKM